MVGASKEDGSPALAAIVRSKAMRGSTLQSNDSRRVLQLEGQTLAGCLALRRAADATANTRFWMRMSCEHEEIRDGTEMRTAHKKGLILKCKPCEKTEATNRVKAASKGKNRG